MKIGLLLGIIGLLLILIIGIFNTIDTEKKIIDCYDKYNSKIIGLECEQQITKYRYLILIGLILVLISFPIIIMESLR